MKDEITINGNRYSRAGNFVFKNGERITWAQLAKDADLQAHTVLNRKANTPHATLAEIIQPVHAGGKGNPLPKSAHVSRINALLRAPMHNIKAAIDAD